MIGRWLTIFLLAAISATAKTNGPPSGWGWNLRGGSVYHFDSGLDDGGAFGFAVEEFFEEDKFIGFEFLGKDLRCLSEDFFGGL